MSILNIKERLAQRIHDAESLDADQKSHSEKQVSFEKKFEAPKISLQEPDVGITEYVSDLPGFHAIIKQRYSDFVVHEIDKWGNVVVLDNTDLPDESAPQVNDIDILDDETKAKLEKLPDGKESVEIDVTEKTKEERKTIHQYVKEKYGSNVLSNTSDKGEKKFITVEWKSDGNDRRRPGHIPKFLHFSLFKSNIDTTHAIGILARKLNTKPDLFNIAGTKDKRGNTTQKVSVKNIYAKQLRMEKPGKIYVGNFEYKNFPLALGCAKGNRFEIALRDVSAPEEEIERALTSLKEKGFINYFGMQRFGMDLEAPTYQIGLLLLKGKYADAFDLIMKPREGDRGQPDLHTARHIFAKTKDAHQAFNAIRNKRSTEAQLLLGLKKNGPNAYANAFDMITRNVRMLFLHAYQGLIWNKVVSKRIQKHGLEVLEGDLVIVEKPELTVDCDAEIADDVKLEGIKVRQITKEEVENFTIRDIVMPMPGFAAVYPSNDIFDMYREILAEDGFTVESFESNVKKYSLNGAYRKLVKIPKNVSWEIANYEKPEDDLILSDVDKLEGRTLSANGSKKAVILRMDLGRGTYATMALREILRSDTSWANQASMTEKRAGDEEAREVKRIKLDNGEDEQISID